MYYNSNKTSNDYYNSYKREIAELEAYKKEEAIHKIIKWILTLITLAILVIGGIFLYNYFNPKMTSQQTLLQPSATVNIDENIPTITVDENELPESIQLQKSQTPEYIQRNATDTTQQYAKAEESLPQTNETSSGMNEKDIALIVQIIMSQINAKPKTPEFTPEVSPLEQELEEANTKVYTNQSLENTNHFNKVVLTKTTANQIQNASLMELSDRLDAIVNETETTNSNYANQLQKEVVYRQKEMRYIIVQKGDTLSKIAKKAYGNSDAYPRIFSANPEIIKNPNQIYAGQRLRIPS